MYQLITSNPTTPRQRSSVNRSLLRRVFLLIPLVFVCFALSQTARAVTPAPDGGYPNGNTAEGDDALFSLTSGIGNTSIGDSALFSNTTGNHNTATGANALNSNTTGYSNTANGNLALRKNTTGHVNTAIGAEALRLNTTGNHNTAQGLHALFHNTTGDSNTANGVNALYNNTTGGNNIALGFEAGDNLTTGDNNIDIGNKGAAGESNTIRIGTVKFGGIVGRGKARPIVLTPTFIAGISGVPVTGSAVHVSSSGQLGVPPSSQRFKDRIKPMDKTSEAILALKPVTFHYKKELDPKGISQFGLVAEEVEKVNPDLVARDAKGEVYTVRYEAVNAMLLNEFLKEHAKVEELKKDFQATIARHQKEIADLAATVKEQAAQIQYVSAQLELSKPAPQVAKNDQ
jgi:hypothetical protein